ncbi:terminase small subunit [Cytobacillus sp. FSL W8-0315]|uniref:terminase small subunit n=1 Tax=Cytobacillus sp. FSL W8-0315 TaxID=2921600 RepID=UPI0030F926DC
MLSEQQKKFADLYIASGNAKQAYIEAGYKAKGNAAEASASRLLRNVKVATYIEERNNSLQSDRIADMEEIKRFWSETVRDGEVDLKHRLKASEYIAKTNAAFIEKREVANTHSFESLLEELEDE